MRRIAVLAAGTLGFGLLGPGFAHAAPGTVTVSLRPTGFQRVGASNVAFTGCHALSTPDEPEVVAVATEVTCSINGTSQNAAAPGSQASTFVVAAADFPIVFCVSGRGLFMDTATNDLFTVAAGPTCATFEG